MSRTLTDSSSNLTNSCCTRSSSELCSITLSALLSLRINISTTRAARIGSCVPEMRGLGTVAGF